MQILYVVRSYVGETLTYGDIVIRPWHFTEVPKEQYDALEADVKKQMVADKMVRKISIAMVSDGNPVEPYNEAAVLKNHLDGFNGTSAVDLPKV